MLDRWQATFAQVFVDTTLNEGRAGVSYVVNACSYTTLHMNGLIARSCYIFQVSLKGHLITLYITCSSVMINLICDFSRHWTKVAI